MSDDRDRVRTEVGYCQYITIVSGDVVDTMEVDFLLEGSAPPHRTNLVIFDRFAGKDGTRVKIDGRPVQRPELLAWFGDAKGVRVEADVSDYRYGHVDEVRFTATGARTP